MGKVLLWLWKNKGAVFTGVTLAYEYAPKVMVYVKNLFKKKKDVEIGN